MSKPIWQLVIADMHERDRIGRERYGVPLTAHNGRDALRDAYEEALDQSVYLKQAMVERDEMLAKIKELEKLRDAVLAGKAMAEKFVRDRLAAALEEVEQPKKGSE